MFFIDLKDLTVLSVGIALALIVFLHTLFMFFVWPLIMCYILGYKKYKYQKLLSMGGIHTKYEWHKSDESAKEEWRNYEFVDEVYPSKKGRRIRPESY